MGRKLANEATPEELKELAALLKEYPDAQYLYEWLNAEGSAAMNEDRQAIAAAWRKHEERLQQTVPDYVTGDLEISPAVHHPGPRWRYFAFAFVLLLGGLFFFLQRNVVSTDPVFKPFNNVVSTRYGSKSKLILPDGSQVWLNAGTKLIYPNNFLQDSREVSLSGEAYFDVVHDEKRPFIIHTRKLDIRVLGTAFNVKSYPEDKTTETTLIRGAVAIFFKDRPEEKIILKPNEKIIVANEPVGDSSARLSPAALHGGLPLVTLSRLTVHAQDSLVVETAWVQNKLVFEDESFTAVAARMERWYAVRFHFQDERVKQLHFTGIFERESLPEALEALRLSAHFRYRIDKEQVFIK